MEELSIFVVNMVNNNSNTLYRMFQQEGITWATSPSIGLNAFHSLPPPPKSVSSDKVGLF